MAASFARNYDTEECRRLLINTENQTEKLLFDVDFVDSVF